MRDWDFDGQLAGALRISGWLVVFMCLVLVSQPKDPVAGGFLAGTITGMWNAYFLGKRVRATVGLPVPKAKASVKFGVFLRVAIIIAVLFFVYRVSWFSLYATAAGMFITPCIFTCGAVARSLRETGKKSA
ncbi:MAG: ATP synthase I chain [Pelotomaculum sp. PtaU1.Bin035]|nr:MAG: ATP synthase I chain [Pelotomaculum sp. PtaU1.Bin035]